MLRHPHDRLFKRVFSDVFVAAGHLASALPPALAEAYDWERLAVAPTELVSRPLRARETDLRFAAPRRGEEQPSAELLLLFHHQSRADRRMALRLAEEAVGGAARWADLRPGARRLPWILPVLVSSGRRRWTAPTDLRQLLDLPAGDREGWRHLLPSVPYLLQDLAVTPDEAIGGAPLGVVALRALKHAWRRDLWERLPGWETEVVAAHRRHGEAATEPLFSYMINICPAGPDGAVSRWISDKLGEEEVGMVKSWAQKLHEEGLEQGREQGLEQGVAQGARREREALVLRLLSRRFGALPADAAPRVHAATDAELDRVVDEIFQATSLSALLPG